MAADHLSECLVFNFVTWCGASVCVREKEELGRISSSISPIVYYYYFPNRLQLPSLKK